MRSECQYPAASALERFWRLHYGTAFEVWPSKGRQVEYQSSLRRQGEVESKLLVVVRRGLPDCTPFKIQDSRSGDIQSAHHLIPVRKRPAESRRRRVWPAP